MSVLPLGRVLASSVGKKLLIAVTGLFLTIFLLVHCYVNIAVFWDNPQETFNRAAHFMATNLLIRISEIGLFLAFIVHIYQGLALHFSNKSKRKIQYAVSPGNKSSRWYSRSMGVLGSLILIFLVVHLAHFWVPGRILHSLAVVSYAGEDMHDMYSLMYAVFQNPVAVFIYIIGCVALAWHLYHGIQGAFRTFGLTHQTYLVWLRCAGGVYAVVICLLFILMPLSMYFGFYPNLRLGW